MLNVQVNIIHPEKGQSQLQRAKSKPKSSTGERIPGAKYRAIVGLGGSRSTDTNRITHTTLRRLTKQEWEKLRRAFIFGHSLGAIAGATNVSRGTLSAYSARHKWSRDRVAGTEILRKQNER
jgi:hypothetical protein